MLGDYYTNQLLSGAASTSMIGNLIQGQLGTPGLEGQGAVLSCCCSWWSCWCR